MPHNIGGAPRIVSLVPSGTDLVAALGLGERLVGVSHECDHEVARGRPVLTSSDLPAAGSGGEGDAAPALVDTMVAEAVRSGRSLYHTDLSLLRRLEPDVVLAQDVCDVCAVSAEGVRCEVPAGAELVRLAATTLAELEDDLLRVGKATGADGAAAATVAALRGQRARVARQVAGRPRRAALALEWGDPPFLGGHWVPELVEGAGGTHALSRPGRPSRRSTWDEVAGAGADVVVFCPCGYGLAAAVEEAQALVGHLGPGVELWATDATSLFSRCTPQAVVAALGVLAGILHPDVAPPPRPALAVRVA